MLSRNSLKDWIDHKRLHVCIMTAGAKIHPARNLAEMLVFLEVL